VSGFVVRQHRRDAPDRLRYHLTEGVIKNSSLDNAFLGSTKTIWIVVTQRVVIDVVVNVAKAGTRFRDDQSSWRE
jgi:hypothetical protein